MSEMESALNEFIAECREIIDRVNNGLIKLEQGDRETSLIDSIYRDMHTMKGSAQLFGYQYIGNIAHAMESSLEPARKGKITNVSGPFIDALLDALRVIEKLFDAVSAGQPEETCRQESEEALAKLVAAMSVAVGTNYNPLPGGNEHITLVTDPLLEKQRLGEKKATSPAPTKNDSLKPSTPVKEKPMEVTAEKTEARKDAGGSEAPTVDSTIRVPVQVLDKLMNLVGELVLVRNQVLQFSQKVEDLEFLNLSQNLNMVTTDLQAEVMRTRMQPIGSIVGKFQRVVRDIASSLSKKIDINIQGAETEVDKTLLEAVKDPLTHLIRNSCDHGIELPNERRDNGKSEMGNIGIKAYHEGGQVVIEISDDGRGLNYKKISQKAIERSLFSKEQLDKMSDRELAGIIFMAGFSTADQVSAVSGRGVGMDVVKTNIEKIGGTIDVVSFEGKGMVISLRIPLTLAIVPAMIIRSGTERFAIPQVKLVELVRVERGSDTGQKIEFLHGKPMLRLRGHLLPLVHLKETLGDMASVEVEQEIKMADSSNVVVLQSEGISFGLIVDDILDTGDIVVKPVGQNIKALDTFSGATIMGDGSVALILDVAGLSKRSVGDKDGRVSQASNTAKAWINNEVDTTKVKAQDSQDFLLFETNAKGTYALPLCLVHRLEEFPAEQIEYSGNQKVLRYRGAILPIITINTVLDLKAADTNPVDSGRVSVIVVQKNARSYGIEVNSILDVVSISGMIDDNIRDRRGVMGSAIHNEEVVVMVDILNIIDGEAKKFGIVEEKITTTGKARTRPLRVLLAEDTAFFRKQILKFLEKSGFHVTVAFDGQEAFRLVKEQASNQFDLVVSDIEMPNMTGLELARAIRELPGYKNTPLIAVTSKFKQRDREEGEQAGFDRYLEKLNEEVLLKEIHGLIQ